MDKNDSPLTAYQIALDLEYSASLLWAAFMTLSWWFLVIFLSFDRGDHNELLLYGWSCMKIVPKYNIYMLFDVYAPKKKK